MNKSEASKRNTTPDSGLEHMGKRAGFESKIVRVPIGLVPMVDEVIRLYKLAGMQAANESLSRASSMLTALTSTDIAA